MPDCQQVASSKALIALSRKLLEQSVPYPRAPWGPMLPAGMTAPYHPPTGEPATVDADLS